MDKKEIIKIIDKMSMEKDEYYILGGSALVILGIKEKTKDIDICVSELLFKKLKEKYKIKEENKNDSGFYKLSSEIEIVVNNKKEFNRIWIENYPVENPQNILKFKEKRNLEQDKIDIEKIKEYLKKN